CCCRGRKSALPDAAWPAYSCLEADGTVAGAHLTDEVGRLALFAQQLQRRLALAGGHDRHHANAAVEGTVHLLGADLPGVGQPVEYRLARPGAAAQMD